MAIPLEPSDEKLYRQVRGSGGYINDGVPTSLAFKPLPKDEGELSVDLGSMTSAQSCFEAFRRLPGDSVGVWAVTTQECKDEGLDAYHKPKTDPPVNPSHGIIDFRHLTSDGQRKRKAARLVEKAIARRREWPLEQSPEVSQTQGGSQEQAPAQPQPPGGESPSPSGPSVNGTYGRLIDLT